MEINEKVLEITTKTLDNFIKIEGDFDKNNNYIRFNKHDITKEEKDDIIARIIRYERGRVAKKDSIIENKGHEDAKKVYIRLNYLKKRYIQLLKRDNNAFNRKFDNFVNWCSNSKRNRKKQLICFYCGSSKEQWKNVISKASDEEDYYIKGKLHISKKQSFKGYNLEIDRKNPQQEYTEKNCVFACHLCNNAKSDMIQADDYKVYFKNATKSYIDYLENNKI